MISERREGSRRKKLEWTSRYSLHRVQRRYLHLGMTAEREELDIYNEQIREILALFSLFCRLRTMANVDNDS